jgi:hypothetical protein
MQRISIYADDVVLFFRPHIHELQAIKELLYIFGEASGLQVNYRKTSATLIRGEEEDKVRTREMLGCQCVEFPIKYLGLQLALRPLTRAQWQPMLDAVVRIVPAWQRGLIDRAGRLTLVKTVMLARPVHHVLVDNPPGWLIQEVMKHIRSFFWVGRKHNTRGRCLVAWENVCKPTRLGGLGVKDLTLHGLALRARWEWLQRTDPSRPWQGLQLTPDRGAIEVFRSLAKISVGSGEKVFFWLDRWINGRCAEDIAPLVTKAVLPRRRNIRRVSDALRDNAWLTDLGADLSLEAWAQCVKLWEEIDLVPRRPQEEDEFAWIGAANGVYSAKDTYRLLCQGGLEFGLHQAIWKSFATTKCKIFCWLALRYRLWTSDRRQRHGLQDQVSVCFICLQDQDTVDHILMRCPFARQTWFECLIAAGLNIVEPNRDSTGRVSMILSC